MTDKQLTSFLSILTPRILTLLVERKRIAEQEAIRILYNSELYATLEKEDTKLWHLSVETLYTMLEEELTTGGITYPEEQ